MLSRCNLTEGRPFFLALTGPPSVFHLHNRSPDEHHITFFILLLFSHLGSNHLPTTPIRSLTLAFVVHGALPSNTLAIYGQGQTKELTELVPGILNQLGPDSLANLRRLAESYQSMTARQAALSAAAGGAGAGAAGGGGGGDEKEGEVGDGDDEIPDLVENFEEAGEKATDLEELE